MKKYDSRRREQSERAIERGLSRSLYEIIKREPMIEVEIVKY
jgi:mRNA degradation ribonuclease J1/J2